MTDQTIPEVTTLFLERLHLGGEWACLWTTGNRSYWFAVGKPIPTPNGKPETVYFGVHPCYAVPPESKSGNTDRRWIGSQNEYIGALNCLYSEFDNKDFDGGQPATRAHVESLDPPPSVIVASGGGLQAYWLLANTWALTTDDDRQRARKLTKAWVAHTGGDTGAADLRRILRLPGSQNFKYDPPRAVAFEHCDLTVAYPLDVLEGAMGDLLADPPTKAADTTLESTPRASEGTYTRADDIAQAERNLARLSQARCDDYAPWLEVGMALSELGAAGLTRWESWSQKSPNYAPGKCAEKWDTFTPGDGLTLASLGQWAKDDDPGGNITYGNAAYQQEPPQADVADLGVAVDQVSEQAPAARRKRITSAEYLGALATLGYTFRMCETSDMVEVGGEPISDPQAAEIRTRMRDLGYTSMRAIEDSYTALAYKHSYHPVKQYLESLTWDGQDHVSTLVSHFTDKHDAFPVFFKRWIVGAIAKVYQAEQNRMLVLDGDQDIGKSHFVRWLASPLPDLFIEGPINPESKDDLIALATCWVWEVAELGSTTRKADREALKHFLSRRAVTVRKPYDRHPMHKPALSSFIGTVNNEGGFLSDPTGNRRFMVSHISEIGWTYTETVDVHQLWAQAFALYQNGEPWKLAGDDADLAQRINREYEVEDPLLDYIRKFYTFTGDVDDTVTTIQILTSLHLTGWHLRTGRGEAMAIAGALRKVSQVEKWSDGDQRGYQGIKRIP